MILEGFEIENWSCVKRVSVANLPPSGVVVLGGPNRRGKSSIVQALRACLMDYPSSSKSSEVTSRFPRGTSEKPIVTVTFRSGNGRYRIQKHFGTNKSEFSSQTPTGEWKIETTSAADAHERTCALAGGSKSDSGLHQLLWLTQAEFHLPDAKKFDATVQSRLRGILGVLQTPLDDRFSDQVKKRWNTWHSGQRKPGKSPALKESCALAEKLRRLESGQTELNESEARFQEIEGLLRQAANLEQENISLDQQLKSQRRELAARREEHLQSQARLSARQHAERDYESAQKEMEAARQEQQQRTTAAQRCQDDEAAIAPTQQKVDEIDRRIETLKDSQTEQRNRLHILRDKRRQLQEQIAAIGTKIAALADVDRLATARDVLLRAEEMSEKIGELEAELVKHSAPDTKRLAAIKQNRQRAMQLQASVDAAAMQLLIVPELGTRGGQLAVDGAAPAAVEGSATAHSVRHKAELVIAGWGTVEFRRGSAAADIDEIASELRRLNEEFTNEAAAFGIATNDPSALEVLIQRTAEHGPMQKSLDSQKREFKKLATEGLEPLRASVQRLETRLANAEKPLAADMPALSESPAELEQLARRLRQEVSDSDGPIQLLDSGGTALENDLRALGTEQLTAKEGLATARVNAQRSGDDLKRLRGEQAIADRLQSATKSLEAGQQRLQETQLTTSEQTIDERLETAVESVRALDAQVRVCSEKSNIIKGRLINSEGLHARRAALAARVDELTRLTESESLERKAVDRLYELFEECRDKQLGTVVAPIQNRVLSWMRVLDIGDYQELRFNDAFLPEKLTARGDAAEFALAEESTGAQEQIGMLVRLALGSVLSSASEPAVAVLDDPLTHCDIGRLSRMRGILRRAAAGDATLTPPAGPLQILIFTCHPEWFRDEKATVIDLEDAEIMTRGPS